jgi:ComF family protein
MGIVDVLLNILFPPRCASCKKEGEFLCTECISRLAITRLQDCPRFYRREKEFKYLDGVIYGVDYAKNPQIKASVQQFKYRFTQELKEFFADLISDKLKQLSMIGGRRIVLIPVPLHRKRYYQRGFNQALLIAKAIQSRMEDRIDVIYPLERVKNTPQQAKLSKKKRHRNLKDAFQITEFKPRKNSVYFIVDDVCTTGTTLESCAKVLKEAGIPKVYGLVVARALKQK